MNTPNHKSENRHGFMRLIGALIIGIGGMLLINQLMSAVLHEGPEPVQDANSQHFEHKTAGNVTTRIVASP